MENLIKEVNFDFDFKKIKKFYEQNIRNNPFLFRLDSCGVQYRKGIPDPWKFVDGTESLVHYGTDVKEKDFCILNELYIDTGIDKIVNHFNLFRARIMSLKGNSCYSVHKDLTWRLHLPIFTNKQAFFYFPDFKEHMFLEEGKIYLINTTEKHTFVNAGNVSRVHLIGCCDNFV